jgi:TetR/AcrR family fatty acid metabolism transcriptional regulator
MSLSQMESTRLVPRGRRELNKLVTRAELLAAARRLFAERGLYESRIEDLTAAAGIAKGTIYGYFRGKVELALAVVTLGFLDLERRVAACAGEGGPRAARIARIVRAHADFFARNPDLMRVFHQVRGVLKFDRPEWHPLRGVLSAYLRALAALLREGQRAGAPRGSATRQARALFGALSGVMSVQASLHPRSRRPLLSHEAIRGIVLLTLSLERPRARGAATGRAGETGM